MKRRTVALLVSLALLSLGLGGCHTEGGGPCCWQGHPQLVTDGSMEPCCEESAPPAVAGASSGPGANGFFSPGGSAALSVARLAVEPLRAVAALMPGVAHPHPLYTLECALRL